MANKKLSKVEPIVKSTAKAIHISKDSNGNINVRKMTGDEARAFSKNIREMMESQMRRMSEMLSKPFWYIDNVDKGTLVTDYFENMRESFAEHVQEAQKLFSDWTKNVPRIETNSENIESCCCADCQKKKETKVVKKTTKAKKATKPATKSSKKKSK